MMTAASAAVAAAAGLAAGWSQRSLVFRYAVPPGDPPRRGCPACGFPVLPAWRAAWPPLASSARCPDCRGVPAPRAGTAGAVSAILLAALAARIHPGLVLAAACWLALCAVPLAFIDAQVQRLPDILTVPAYAGTVMLLLVAAGTGGYWGLLARAVAGGLAMAGFYAALTLLRPLGLGGGDSRMAASLGTLLAWQGWPALAGGLIAGLLLFTVWAAAMLAARRAARGQKLPYGPVMIAGAFLVVLLGTCRF
jgi:leader peptidase (prepilin peptidase)/N-methyltransferase